MMHQISLAWYDSEFIKKTNSIQWWNLQNTKQKIFPYANTSYISKIYKSEHEATQQSN